MQSSSRNFGDYWETIQKEMEEKLTKDGEIKLPILYLESDGLYVHLQREKDKEGKRQEHWRYESYVWT